MPAPACTASNRYSGATATHPASCLSLAADTQLSVHQGTRGTGCDISCQLRKMRYPTDKLLHRTQRLRARQPPPSTALHHSI